MIVLIDLDDVIVDTSTYLYKKLIEKHPDIPEFRIPRKRYHIRDEYSAINLKKVEEILYSSEFQSSIPPVPGSLEAIREIHKRGHNIIFCSSPHEVYETCVLEKYQWLEKHIGRTFARKLHLTDDKTVIYGDLLIDDKPEIEGLITPFWKQILFTRSYNEHVNSKRRLDDWSQWKEIISEL